VLVAGGLAVAGIAAIGSQAGNIERIDDLHAIAVVKPDGSARVTEVIDYDFGNAVNRHGIVRDVPGLSLDGHVVVSSPDAPADVELIDAGFGTTRTRIRIGRADRTVSGRHRYVISFDLPDVAPDGELNWNAIGTLTAVPVRTATVEVDGPWVFTTERCTDGPTGAVRTCAVGEPEPGRLAVAPVKLAAGEGLTVSSSSSGPLAAAPAATIVGPTHGPDSTGAALPAALAGVASLLALGLAAIGLLRLGRDRVGGGGAADAAYGAVGRADAGRNHADPADERLVTERQLAELATIEFAPPAALSPAQGGIVLAESLHQEHKVAWLVEQAVLGAIALQPSGKGHVSLQRLGEGDETAAPVLDAMFSGRDRIELGTYDAHFATGWSALGRQLDHWRTSSGLWEPAGEHRRRLAHLLSFPLLIGGGVLVAAAAAAGSLQRGGWLAVVALGAVGFGLALALAVKARVLSSRTAAGSRAWLQTESFRRFLAGSEAEHAKQAAERGVLRQYVAWAVAVGAVQQWSRAMAAASIAPDPVATSWIMMTPLLGSATSASSQAPQSSGGGGGFSGGLGGGAGGGGISSW